MARIDKASVNTPGRRRGLYGLVAGSFCLGFLFFCSISTFFLPTGSMEGTVLAGDYVFVNKARYRLTTPRTIPVFGIEAPWIPLLPTWNEPDRGDLVVFEYPGDRDQIVASQFNYYLKRCVALAGDTVEMRRNDLYINGVRAALPEHAYREDNPWTANSASIFPRGSGWTAAEYGPLRIPAAGDVVRLDLDEHTINRWRVFIAREGHAVNIDHINGNWVIDGRPAQTYTVERDYLFMMGDNRDNSLDSRYWGYVALDDVVGSPFLVYYSVDPVTGQTRSDRIFTTLE